MYIIILKNSYGRKKDTLERKRIETKHIQKAKTGK